MDISPESVGSHRAASLSIRRVGKFRTEYSGSKGAQQGSTEEREYRGAGREQEHEVGLSAGAMRRYPYSTF